MTEIDDIREAYYVKGKTISTIARDSGKDRKTVRKYILQEDFNVARPTVKETTQCRKLDPYKDTIDEWLESDRRMRRKQRHTARRVYTRLAAMHEDFPCSYRTVALYVKEKKKEIYGTTGACLLQTKNGQQGLHKTERERERDDHDESRVFKMDGAFPGSHARGRDD